MIPKKSVIKIHLWKLNSSISNAWISSITFNAANVKLIFLLFFLSLKLKICIRMEINPGQMDLKTLFKEVCESLIKRIRMQNNINIRRAGEAFSSFITSFKNTRTVFNLPSYLSILPEYITKQTLSNDLIFWRKTSYFPFKRPSNRPDYLASSSPRRSLL